MRSAPAQGEVQEPLAVPSGVQATNWNGAASPAGGGSGSRLVRIWTRCPALARALARARPRKPDPPAMTVRMGEEYRRE